MRDEDPHFTKPKDDLHASPTLIAGILVAALLSLFLIAYASSYKFGADYEADTLNQPDPATGSSARDPPALIPVGRQIASARSQEEPGVPVTALGSLLTAQLLLKPPRGNDV